MACESEYKLNQIEKRISLSVPLTSSCADQGSAACDCDGRWVCKNGKALGGDYRLKPFPLKGPQGVVRTPTRGALLLLGTAIEDRIWKTLVYYCPCRAERKAYLMGRVWLSPVIIPLQWNSVRLNMHAWEAASVRNRWRDMKASVYDSLFKGLAFSFWCRKWKAASLAKELFHLDHKLEQDGFVSVTRPHLKWAGLWCGVPGARSSTSGDISPAATGCPIQSL